MPTGETKGKKPVLTVGPVAVTRADVGLLTVAGLLGMLLIMRRRRAT